MRLRCTGPDTVGSEKQANVFLDFHTLEPVENMMSISWPMDILLQEISDGIPLDVHNMKHGSFLVVSFHILWKNNAQYSTV